MSQFSIRRGAPAGLLVLALVAVSCGGSDEAAPEGSAPTEVTSEVTETTGAPAEASETTEAVMEEGDGAPQRIVSLSPTATEILFAIGAGDRVVAVDSYSNYPAEAPITDLSGFEPNLEAIVGYEPDLVIISYDPGELASGLEKVGVETLVQPSAVTLDDTYAQIAELGVITGELDGAADLNASIRQGLDQVVASLPETDAPLRVYHELDGTFYSASSASFIGQVYAMLGLENIADPADADGFGYPQLSPEIIIESNPDLIVITDQVGYSAAEVAARPGWDAISAVQNDKVVTVEADIASRWGPRVVDFARTIAEQLSAVPVG